MNQNKARITAAALVCILTVSLAACNKNKKDDSKTVVNNTNKAGESTTVPEYKYPETDNNGNKITMVEVTNKDGKKVTDTNGSVVTQVGVLDKNGAVITDKKGALVTPSLNDSAHTVAVKATDAAASGTDQDKSPVEVIEESTGPTVRLLNASDNSDQFTAKPGDEIVVKLSSDANKGYAALLSWVDVNTDIFEIVKNEPGDPTLADYKKSKAKAGSQLLTFKKSDNAAGYPTNINKTDNFTTIVCLYYDSKLEKITDEMTIATITLKIKDNVTPGDYNLDFDSIQDVGKSKCSYIQDGTGKIVSCTPKYINAKVKVQ